MAAAAFRTEELGLEKSEAEQLAKAIADVAEFYPMDIDPKTLAWWNLGVAVAMVEGPRAWFLMKKAQADRANRAKPTQRQPNLTPVADVAPGVASGFPPFTAH